MVVIALCAVFGVGLISVVARQINQRTSFTDKIQPLLDQGNLDSVTQECRERLRMFPDDATAHFYLGTALQRQGELRQSLIHLRRVPELQAGWDVGPMVAAVEKRLQSQESGPDLKIVSATKTGDEAPRLE